jgi:site-specific DNA-methyltransferase (adenine-specific)
MRIDVKKSLHTGDTCYMSGCNGMLPTMFDVPPVSKKDRIHQSELPLSLCEQILDFVTYEGEVVLDSFAVSGVLGETALNKRRNCILIEILKENIDKIKERLGSKIYFESV